MLLLQINLMLDGIILSQLSAIQLSMQFDTVNFILSASFGLQKKKT